VSGSGKHNNLPEDRNNRTGGKDRDLHSALAVQAYTIVVIDTGSLIANQPPHDP
jgi:hypothetical protein